MDSQLVDIIEAAAVLQRVVRKLSSFPETTLTTLLGHAYVTLALCLIKWIVVSVV